ncbi:hypothetical protein EYC84_011100 [Monilinia fructicola]|uniref:2EXR domain-containing protein n=1 Tax=Monilinia fructicola TaxID=38448 RepID=A0A5M9J7B3_MONFR|nr:hypothetical protein EYC84_011100 [Monilinia fructicola]
MSTNIELSQVTKTANNEIVPFLKRFPKDIEAMIFEITCYHERIVPVHMSESTITVGGDTGESPKSLVFLCFRSSNPVPAVMHVNGNSREIGLRHYKCAFGVEDIVSKEARELDGFGVTKSRIYVNSTFDIVCAEPGPRWALFMKKMKESKIQQIALNKSAWEGPFYPYFNYAACPIDGSHNSGWIDEEIQATTLWNHSQPTNLYHKIRIERPFKHTAFSFITSDAFCCCAAMKDANEFTSKVARLQTLQERENELTDEEGLDRQKLKECPEWLYKNLDTWQRPKNRFLLHW